MVKIIRKRESAGITYQVSDFAQYSAELKSRGFEPPLVSYRVFIDAHDTASIASDVQQYEQQIARFFMLSPVSPVSYEITEEN